MNAEISIFSIKWSISTIPASCVSHTPFRCGTEARRLVSFVSTWRFNDDGLFPVTSISSSLSSSPSTYSTNYWLSSLSRNWDTVCAVAAMMPLVSRYSTADCLTHIPWTFCFASTACFTLVRPAAVLLISFHLEIDHRVLKKVLRTVKTSWFALTSYDKVHFSLNRTEIYGWKRFCGRCFLLNKDLSFILSDFFSKFFGSEVHGLLDIPFQKHGDVRVVVWS